MLNYYAIAIATGLTHERALMFAEAMKHKEKADINHLIVK